MAKCFLCHVFIAKQSKNLFVNKAIQLSLEIKKRRSHNPHSLLIVQEYRNTGIQIKFSPVPFPGAWEVYTAII